MQGETALIVDDGVAGVGAALIADDHVGGLRQHIRDLALALVAPVGAYDRFYHNVLPPETGIRNRSGGFALSGFQHKLLYYTSFFHPAQLFILERNAGEIAFCGDLLRRLFFHPPYGAVPAKKNQTQCVFHRKDRNLQRRRGGRSFVKQRKNS